MATTRRILIVRRKSQPVTASVESATLTKVVAAGVQVQPVREITRAIIGQVFSPGNLMIAGGILVGLIGLANLSKPVAARVAPIIAGAAGGPVGAIVAAAASGKK